jgi:hypothetical protein
MCGSKGRRLVISSSYHTYISFILDPFSHNTTYLYWLATSYNCPYFMVWMWLYHWQSMYPFTLVPLQKWMYNSPQHTLGCCCNYCFGKWSTCSKRSLPPFLSSHFTMNEYPYHQRRISNFDGCCHYWSNSHRYGVVNIDDNNTCSNDFCLGEDTIINRMKTRHDFIPLAMETYGCFHFCFDSFLTVCAQIVVLRH